MLGPNAGDEPASADPRQMGERLRRQIKAIRAATARPFAVNVPIGRGGNRVFSDRSIEVLIEEGVRIAIIVTGSPEVYTTRLKQAGVFVIHAVASVKHARKAESCGVDAVVAEGFDAGGHSGFDEIPTASLVPQVAEACAIPVIAAGGIVDGRGLVAALGYGAQAVYMGTRFMATVECPIHDKVKQAIVAALDTGSTSWGRSTEVARTLKNRFTEEYRRRELSGRDARGAARLHLRLPQDAGRAPRRGPARRRSRGRRGLSRHRCRTGARRRQLRRGDPAHHGRGA